MNRTGRCRSRSAEGGYSLVELLVVLGIIAIMAAVALPAIAGYLRNYRIRAAGQQVMTELMRARMRAIQSNTNFGVLFIPGVEGNDQQFQFWIEDDPANPGARPIALPVDPATGAPNGTRLTLPEGIRFAPAAAGAGWIGRAVRFSRLGRACLVGSAAATCPDPVGAAPPATAFVADAPPFTIQLIQDRSALTVTLTLETGGIMRMQQP